MIGSVIGPMARSFSANAVFVKSAALLPLYEATIPDLLDGTPLEFAAADEIQELAVPIPRLEGLDDIEIERVDFGLHSGILEKDTTVGGSPQSGGVEISFDAAGATVSLMRLEFEDLRVTANATTTFVIEGDTTAPGSLSNVVYSFSADDNKTVVATNAAGAGKYVHVLVRPRAGNAFGPPAATAPAFAMPGNGGAMYGPALAGARLRLFSDAGKIGAILELFPPLPGSRALVMLGHADEESANRGLPNDVVAVDWSAANVKGVFDIRPKSVSITAAASTAGSDQPVVAEFPSDPGPAPIPVDFAGVARSLLRSAYPASQGSDLGLKLLFRSGSAGLIRVNLGAATARYISRPLQAAPAALELLGAPESVELSTSAAYRPSALSFTLDGVFGPARLTLDSDTAQPDVFHGFRIGEGVRIARQIALTSIEQHLPLVRLGLYGRASEDCELLVSLHEGDALRIASPVAEPLSLVLSPELEPAWQRVLYPAPGLLPPHPAAFWLVARVTRGVFWWYGDPVSPGPTQRSGDDGGSFTAVAGRPTCHVSVNEVDAATGNPTPLMPVGLWWTNGQLNPDIVGVSGAAASLPPEFRRFWIAERAAHSDFLNAVPGLGGKLRLTFWSSRDVDLTVSDAVLTYDPWNA